jgi:hypothetical protein
MVDILTVSTIVTAASVVVGVVFAVLELRHLAKTRTDVILKIYERFGSREIVNAIMKIGGAKFESFDDYVKKYGLPDTVQVLEIFDEVRILLEQGLVDINLVNNQFGPSVNTAWESNIQTLIDGIRKSSNRPSFFSHVDYLYKRLNTYKKKNVKHSIHSSTLGHDGWKGI